jgi:tetratricopeptide (TPR) repeat protein
LSLEYVPNSAGYLDTLGRCYYAKQDYENAVKYQARAVALEPHSGQIRRQMKLFEEALAADESR